MNLYISKTSGVSIREQISTQISLAISSGELPANKRLPSVRELARRLSVHSNTVSSAYRDLELHGWVESRKGSGVYVRERYKQLSLNELHDLDHMISSALATARKKKLPLKLIKERIQYWLQIQPPDHFLLIEPDKDLQKILAHEIEAATKFPVKSISLKEAAEQRDFTGAIPLSLIRWAEDVRKIIPHDTDCLVLHSSPLKETLQQIQTLPRDSFISVISCWEEFLSQAEAILTAAGFSSATLSLRNSNQKGWHSGLRNFQLVITDSLVPTKLLKETPHLKFNIIAESSLRELKEMINIFLA